LNLVTGGAGFIGSAVVRNLLARGLPVRVVDDRSKRRGARPVAGVEYVDGDISDAAVARLAFVDVEVCFHLAARIGGIGYFHRFPADILDENNQMLSAVFRTATDAAAKVVYVSSSMVFERAEEWPTPETALDAYPPPFSAYGFSKLVGEWYCRAFHEQFGTRFSIGRPFNAYGPGEHPDDEPGLAHVIPDLVRKILAGERPIPIFGDGSQTRSFTFVDDVADAIVTIGLDPRAEGEGFNIGTGDETSIRDLARMLWRACGNDGDVPLRWIDPLPVDVRRRVPDVSKIRDRLGWTASVPLEDGIRRTIAWYTRARLPGIASLAPRSG
jgi:UDP-glucose 4-epimerase